VPEVHASQEKLPAVSGSSGRLVIERTKESGEKPYWPGQIFAESELDYAVAMHRYAEATQDRLMRRKTDYTPSVEEATRWRKEWEGRHERYQAREVRKKEDIAWKDDKVKHRFARQAYRALSKSQQEEQAEAHHALRSAWSARSQLHLKTLLARKQEDADWHLRNRQLKDGPRAETRRWIAILVVTDNCSRQCLGLPVFLSGSHLSSEELVAALRTVLPAELAFVISDQGVQFRSLAFAQLAAQYGFIHIPVYRHRPESNGIAERFVLTLKTWLQNQSWQSGLELEPLLKTFQPEFNARPHQGLAIPGLSPDEFANSIWLL